MEKLNSYQKYTFRVANRKISRLIENIEIGVNMALIQSERILEDNAAIELPRVSPGPDTFLFLKLFTDIHFYLVSVANINKSIGKLDRALDDKLDDINKDYRDFFDAAKAVRNCQEHLDERIESGKYYGKSLYDDWIYEICGKTAVIGPPAAKKLIQLYIELDLKLEILFPKKASKGCDMTRKQHLRRVAITCLHCLRNLAYFRAGPNEPVLKTKSQFWINANNNFLDICVLEWCKLFGDMRGKHYWGKIISDKQAFFLSMLQNLKIDEAELETLINEMRVYRDKFLAHLDLEPTMFIPDNLNLAQKSVVEYLYNYILAEEDEGNFFNDAPSNAGIFFKNHLNYGKAEYEKVI